MDQVCRDRMVKYIGLVLRIILSSIASTAMGQGVIFDDEVYKKAPIKAALMRGDYEVPAVASMKQYCPQPGHQLAYSTSVAWAIAWQARTILYNKNYDITTKDEKNNHVFAPSYVYNKARLPDDEECQEGITLDAGLEMAKEYGIPPLNQYLYFCGGPADEQVDSVALQFAISDYSKVFELNASKKQKIQLVKKTISEGWPVVVGMITPPSFRRAKEFWQPTESPSLTLPGQALCVVGYDDTKYGGAFEVANSWGWDWGNDGFMWIPYNDFAEYVRYAYEVFVVQKEKEYRLKGNVKFRLASDELMAVQSIGEGRYNMKDTYSSGTKFQVYVTNEDPAFVYVFGSDLTNKSFLLFPHNSTVSPALTYKSNHIAIPAENHFIEFDDTAGTDFLCVLYSKEELDVDRIIKQLDTSQAPFHEKVQHILAGNLLNYTIEWSDSEVSFDSMVGDETIVAVIVEITHN